MSTTTITNNPTRCEMLRDGKKCDALSSYIHVTAFSKQLMCDGCAADLRYATRKAVVPGATPLLEFSLLELVPARRALLADRDAILHEKEELEIQLRRALNDGVALTERLKQMTFLAWGWGLSFAVGVPVAAWWCLR
jgi:hypothetical protein